MLAQAAAPQMQAAPLAPAALTAMPPVPMQALAARQAAVVSTKTGL